MDIRIEKGSIYNEYNTYGKNIWNSNLRVAAYIRVSTLKEQQQGSFWSQKKYFYKKITGNENWSLVDIYGDEGISGTSTKRRPEFNRMINDVKKKKIDLIITKSVSRFARNTVDTLKYVRLLKDMGIGIFFEEENIFTLDSKGEFLLTVLSSIAQQEVLNLSNHLLKSTEMRMSRGEIVGNNLCYGYYWDNTIKNYIIVPEEAEQIKFMFCKRAEGIQAKKIMRYMNENGMRNLRTGKEWTYDNVRSILSNIKYVGDLHLWKSTVVDPINHIIKENNGIRNQYKIKNHHEPIVSREIFDLVQSMKYKRNKSNNTSKERITNILKNNKLVLKRDYDYLTGNSIMISKGEITPTSFEEIIKYNNLVKKNKKTYKRRTDTVYHFSKWSERLNGRLMCGLCLGATKTTYSNTAEYPKMYLCLKHAKNKEMCLYSRSIREDVVIDCYFKAIDFVKENFKENDYINEMIEKVIDKTFDIELYNDLIHFILLGTYDEEQNSYPYVLKFVFKKEKNNDVEFRLNEYRSDVTLNSHKTKVIGNFKYPMDFYSKFIINGKSEMRHITNLDVIIEVDI